MIFDSCRINITLSNGTSYHVVITESKGQYGIVCHLIRMTIVNGPKFNNIVLQSWPYLKCMMVPQKNFKCSRIQEEIRVDEKL